MVEPYLRQSALAHRGLRRVAPDTQAGVGITLSELPFRAMIGLRGDGEDATFLSAIKNAAKIDLPIEPNTTRRMGSVTALWLGPDEWLVTAPAGEEHLLVPVLRNSLGDRHAAVVDLTESRTVIALAGPKAREVLAKGCTLDLHPRAFTVGACAQTGLARAGVLLHLVDDTPTFEITILRSFADYLWTWLADAAREYGVALRTE
ncbi:MAG TPA: sarcosine oxidase subunit gamma family protein [Alphaproteobacteria bacterium]|jgi:sarcosine oxidase subunit gamma|nr:sarcosine oxidase subunit gamma family protein [Alphaproteobacteria bacterium]